MLSVLLMNSIIGLKLNFFIIVILQTEKRKHLVCQKFFSTLFEIKTRRLLTIAKSKHCGQGVTENRGGNRTEPKFRDQKDSIRSFIKSLKVTESHYNRKKSKRLYLPAELSVKKLCFLHNECREENLQVIQNS